MIMVTVLANLEKLSRSMACLLNYTDYCREGARLWVMSTGLLRLVK